MRLFCQKNFFCAKTTHALTQKAKLGKKNWQNYQMRNINAQSAHGAVLRRQCAKQNKQYQRMFGAFWRSGFLLHSIFIFKAHVYLRCPCMSRTGRRESLFIQKSVWRKSLEKYLWTIASSFAIVPYFLRYVFSTLPHRIKMSGLTFK